MEDIIIILVLIVANGIFSMAEVALISSRKSSLEGSAKRGSRGAAVALKLRREPDRFLSTVQIGITLIGILTGLFSGAAFSGQLAEVFVGWGLGAVAARRIASVLIVSVVTYLSIVVGELVPKRVALAGAERVAVIVAPAMYALSLATLPVVWLLSKSTALLLKLLGIRGSESKVTEQEILDLIREGADSGEVQEVEQDIMARALVMGDLCVSAIMTYRTDLVTLTTDMTAVEVREVVTRRMHRAYPVYDPEREHVKGIAKLHDLVPAMLDPGFDLKRCVHRGLCFPENMTAYDALEALRSREACCGLVYDEFGSLKGMVTLHDVLESLVGMLENPAENPGAVVRNEKSGRDEVDGLCSWYDFLAHYSREDLFDPRMASTVAGNILATLRRIPSAGDECEILGFRLRVESMDHVRIALVSVVSPPAAPEA